VALVARPERDRNPSLPAPQRLRLPLVSDVETPARAAHAPTWLTPDLYAWLTAKRRYPVLATIGGDGMPSLSVMWAIVEPDGGVLMNTAKGRRKYLDMVRDPRISLCFEDGYDYVTLEGTVALRDDPDYADIERLRDHFRDDTDFRSIGASRVSLDMTIRRVLTHFERLRGEPAPEG
jgi:PPOX class probable F420-dependent enzyme